MIDDPLHLVGQIEATEIFVFACGRIKLPWGEGKPDTPYKKEWGWRLSGRPGHNLTNRVLRQFFS